MAFEKSVLPTPGSNHRRLALLMIIMLPTVLLACRQQQPELTLPAVPSHQPSPTPTTAPVIATSTPETALASPQATVTLPVEPTAIWETIEGTDVPRTCDQAYFFEPPPSACPLDEPVRSPAAEQPFESGFMVWLETLDSVFVFYWDGRWQRFDDTWSEGEPESDPAISPPAERYQPIRGFGKVWRERPSVRQELGWALGPELGFETATQEARPEGDGQAVRYLRVFNGQVLALISRAPNAGEWVIAAS